MYLVFFFHSTSYHEFIDCQIKDSITNSDHSSCIQLIWHSMLCTSISFCSHVLIFIHTKSIKVSLCVGKGNLLYIFFVYIMKGNPNFHSMIHLFFIYWNRSFFVIYIVRGLDSFRSNTDQIDWLISIICCKGCILAIYMEKCLRMTSFTDMLVLYKCKVNFLW